MMNASRKELTAGDGVILPEKQAGELLREMEAFDREGIEYAFVLTDLEGRKIFSANETWKFCSQSTIKAPYVCSLLDASTELFDENYGTIKKIITVSDNDAYAELRFKYGNACFVRWCEKAGVTQDVTPMLYPRNITVCDMAKLWSLMIKYIKEKAPSDLRDWFYGTKYSAIFDTLGKRFKTWTKAGWENGIEEGDEVGCELTPDPRFTDGDPLNDETATNDTGVVFNEKGAYILAVFTNIPTNPPKLYGLIKAINSLFEAI